MRVLVKLERSIKIVYVVLQVLFILCTIGVAIGVIRGDVLTNNSLELTKTYNFRSWKFLIILISYFLISYYFIRAIAHLKYTIPFLKKGFAFSKPVALKLKQAGTMLIYIGNALAVVAIAAPILLASKISIDIVDVIIIPSLFTILGLFFNYFGQAFLEAKDLKNENNLTI